VRIAVEENGKETTENGYSWIAQSQSTYTNVERKDATIMKPAINGT